MLVGVVHLVATPGAPRYRGSMDALIERACSDARALAQGGCDALLVENFGDLPFFAESVPPETAAALAIAVREVRGVVGSLPVGVNVLRNDARTALGVCAAAGASFLRVNVHTGAAVTDQGLLMGRAAETVRERERLCPAVLILADVHVKHGAPLARRPIADEAEDAWSRGGADALIVSGRSTGDAPRSSDLVLVRERLPEAMVLIGSGLTAQNAGELLRHADGAICGTALKREGKVENEVDPERVARVRASVRV